MIKTVVFPWILLLFTKTEMPMLSLIMSNSPSKHRSPIRRSDLEKRTSSFKRNSKKSKSRDINKISPPIPIKQWQPSFRNCHVFSDGHDQFFVDIKKQVGLLYIC